MDKEDLEQFKIKIPSEGHGYLAILYFGLPDKDGHIDSNYPDLVKATYDLTDDCIFFSKLLCEDLSAHGKKLKELLGDKSISISKPLFDIAKEKGLMPDDANYNNLLKMYKKLLNKANNYF